MFLIQKLSGFLKQGRGSDIIILIWTLPLNRDVIIWLAFAMNEKLKGTKNFL